MTQTSKPASDPAPSPAESKPGNATPAPLVEPGSARATSPRLPRDELNTLAEDYGLDSTRYGSRGEVLEALAGRKTLIAGLDREAMLEVVRWGRRPVTATATKEQLALEIARIRRMNFDGLSDAGLYCLARLREVECNPNHPRVVILKKLRRREGMFERLNRKRRSVVAGLAAKIVGDEEDDEPYRYLPPPPSGTTGNGPETQHLPAPQPAVRPPRLRDEIEDRGLFGGLADRVRRSADTYVNAKLDEIELRIDKKLDEIDKRLGEWRDKEIANRVRIIKITLWASLIVSIISLVYAYITRQVF